MRQKHNPLIKYVTIFCGIAGVFILILVSLKDNLFFFVTPSDLIQKNLTTNVRLGGVVKKGTILKNPPYFYFSITDGAVSIPVSYKGVLPSLFREDQTIVVEGQLDQNKVFIAKEVLAKHDENYKPPLLNQRKEK